MNRNQIFYDGHRSRWRISKRALLALVVFLVSIFSLFGLSIIIHPSLPLLDLGEPTGSFRGNALTEKSGAQSVEIPFEHSQKTTDASRSFQTMAYFVNWDDNSFTSLKERIGFIDQLMAEWLYLGDGEGNLYVNDKARQTEVLAYIKQTRPEMNVAVLINNYNEEKQSWDSDALSAMLGNQSARKNVIDSALSFVDEQKINGISIDFEGIYASDQEKFLQFMRELYAAAHVKNITVSSHVPLGDESFNLVELVKYSDYLIFMAYDENSAGDTKAGPIASQGWYQKNLRKIFSKLPPEKYVIALGGYGYDWEGGEKKGTDITFQQAMEFSKKSGAPVVFDGSTLNPTVTFQQQDVVHKVWFLDGATLFNEISFAINEGKPRGFALWRLGSEDPSVWNVLASSSVSAEVAKSLERISYGNDIIYEGQGEILHVANSPGEGKRVITIEGQVPYVVNEEYEEFPSSYVVSRWGKADKKIALTFDDGPNEKYTPEILDILESHNVPATFFMIAMNASANVDLLARMDAHGHEIGNHTYTHPNIANINQEQFSLELSAAQRLFEGVLHKRSLLFRPPYSEDVEPQTPDHMKPLLMTKDLGYYTVGMHIDPQDWQQPGSDVIANRVVEGVLSGKGNIVLLHDSGGDRSQTVQALPKIIETLQQKGYEFVSVSQLMNVPRDSVMPKITARESAATAISSVAVGIVMVVLKILQVLFLAGIILGSLRFVFLGMLAIIQALLKRGISVSILESHSCPLVDVVIPAYNEQRVIVKTVSSILASNYKNFRIIVIDDGSTDDTFGLLWDKFAGHPLVRILWQPNSGKAEALNYGVATAACGEIVVTLDADTVFLPETIGNLVKAFDNKKIAAVAGNAKVGNRFNILTRWQALEYITSQNLDRRAFELLNCISVVPGSVGAWKRSALQRVGGFSSDTLAEDADLTFALLRNGYRVVYQPDAIAFTEAPHNVKNFIKQRFRWMYGTMQATWKHRGAIAEKNNTLRFVAIPNMLIFQVLFPFISPIMDLMLVVSLFWVIWQGYHQHIDFSVFKAFQKVLIFYGLFLIIDMLTAVIPFLLEKKEQWSLMLFLPLQRFFYRQLMYYVALKSAIAAVKGTIVGWGKVERSATVAQVPIE